MRSENRLKKLVRGARSLAIKQKVNNLRFEHILIDFHRNSLYMASKVTNLSINTNPSSK